MSIQCLLDSNQAANAYLCDSSLLPLTMNVEQLKKELSRRGVYFEEFDTRESLVHLLEMDILLRSRSRFVFRCLS